MTDHLALVNTFHNKDLSHVSFNQDNSCLLYIWNNQFGIWDTKTMRLRYDKKFNKGLGTGNILYKTNFVLFGGGSSDNDPLIPANKCMLWDDNKNKFLAEILIGKQVITTKIVPRYFYTVTKDSILIHDSTKFLPVQEIKTGANPAGLISISTLDSINPPRSSTNNNTSTDTTMVDTTSGSATTSTGTTAGVTTGTTAGGMADPTTAATAATTATAGETQEVSRPENKNVIATLGLALGEVQIYHVEDGDLLSIKAHKSDISCLCLNRTGSLVATTSKKGTLIRVFDTKGVNDLPLYEFRRGTGSAEINNLCFNKIGDLLLASTIGGTIHVYRLDSKNQNKYFLKSLGIKGGLDYSESNLYIKNDGKAYLAGFDSDGNNIIIVTYDGIVYRYKLDATAETDIKEALGDLGAKTAPSYLKWTLAETICLISKQK